MPTSGCPSCAAVCAPRDAFCEVCGLDFATGRPPEPGLAAAARSRETATAQPATGWIAVIEADTGFFSRNRAETDAVSFPEGRAPTAVPLVRDEVVVGRRNEAKALFPDIDLSGPVADPGVSRRHAVLRRQPDGSWALTDEGSTNGTRVNGAPVPIEPGRLVSLQEGDRINLGAFTVITLFRDAEARA